MTPPNFPPGPRARFPGALLLQTQGDLLGFFRRNVETFGDIFGFSPFGRRVVYLQHPDMIRDVLVTNQRLFAKGRALERARPLLGNGLLTSEGDFHLRQRRLAQPAFHRDRITQYATAMVSLTERMSATWHDGMSMDVHEQMMSLTLHIVASTLFGTTVDDEAKELHDALDGALESFNLRMLPGAELMERLPLPWVRRFNRSRARLDATVYRIIRERRASSEDRGDLLSMLLSATDAEGDGTGMSDEQLRDEVMTLFLAGHETTANALTWAWYLLCRNPKAEERLHAEVDALGHTPTIADLPRLEYTRRVVMEAMRLYPPAYAIGRRVLEDYEVGGFTIPADSMVVVSQFLVHRDPRWFPNPEVFDPDRWLPEVAATRPKFSYFPFGAGTRICIGEQFAWTEAILVIATLAQRWRFWLAPKQRIAVQPRITLRPKYGIKMVVRDR